MSVNTVIVRGCYVQEDAELEPSKYAISVSVISPKKVGDGVGAYMVYKIVTKVCRLKLTRTFLLRLISYLSNITSLEISWIRCARLG